VALVRGATASKLSIAAGSEKARATRLSDPVSIHPRAVPIIALDRDADEAPGQSSPQDARDVLDSELRYRMISERAFQRYVERGCEDGGDLDDWYEAEAEVDDLLLNPEGDRARGA